MCRFSASLAPPPEAPADGLEAILDDADDFNWFDAIDELPELEGNMAASLEQVQAPAARESESSERATDGVDSSTAKSAASAGCSDTSSYDLVEMFKQQVEQDPLAVLTTAPQGAPQASFTAAQFAAVPQQQMMCGVGAPFSAACMPTQFLAPTPMTPSSGFLPAAAAGIPAVLNNTVGAPAGSAAATLNAASAPACGRRSRANKSQEEIDAAVERIKQKRRESAQRSRARKNEYMRQLELENQALKDEVQRLQQVLATVQRGAYQHHHAAALVQLGAI